MSRRFKVSLIVLAVLVVLTAGLLWALPEIVRRLALDQIPKRTGRVAAIGDVDLNVFTGRLAIKGFRLADREGPAPFVKFERFDVRLSPLALLRSHVHLAEIALTAPTVRIVRTGPAEFNFSDLIGGGPEPVAPPATPGRWAVTVERLRLARGRVEVADRASTPPTEWLLQDLDVDATSFTTRSMGSPGLGRPGRGAAELQAAERRSLHRRQHRLGDPEGDLQYRVRFKLDGNQLAADNELVVGQLQVAPASASDEVKRRIGLPLGLIVGLIKDQKGEIRASIPVTGLVNDPKLGLRDAIWTAVKNVLVNIVTAPFKAIGRLFSSGDKVEAPTVDPVTFAAGSAVLSPAMEEHLLRVADFLRRSPFVSLSMTSVPAGADVDALKGQAVAARLQALREERGLEDAAAALAAYFKERLPDVAPPATMEEQVTFLREREPTPTASLTDLARRRLEATRERLVAAEGIPSARLAIADAPAAAPGGPAGEGRVEFAVVAGE